jgi:predicted AlkP superfamily pyrophosphatase or phosphodiesterase
MHKTVVINAVGLSANLLSTRQAAPRLHDFRSAGSTASIGPVLPAVTTTVQSTYLTGQYPGGENGHGVVANGWYFRETAEVRFWLQNNALVGAPKIWDKAKSLDASFTCANLFWWYNMYSSADYSVTPRPMYPADGRKIPDVYTHPANLRHSLQQKLGTFPLFNFWGPATNIKATQWIADASIEVDRQFNPTLTLIYLPHLDYILQKGGDYAKDLLELDAVCGQLIDHYRSQNARILVLSEYGITPVSQPVHLNRILRQVGLLTVREELGHELLDCGASQAFAVADHQIAHVYVNNRARLAEVKKLLEQTPGVAAVLDDDGKRAHHLDHPRSGELICLSAPHTWFTYYFWLDDTRAPDYARTVDIHRKPGYDPVELFLDPKLTSPKLKIAWTLARRKIGMRAMMNVIPLDATLVKGSHGLAASDPNLGPLLMSTQKNLLSGQTIPATAVCDTILRHLLD